MGEKLEMKEKQQGNPKVQEEVKVGVRQVLVVIVNLVLDQKVVLQVERREIRKRNRKMHQRNMQHLNSQQPLQLRELNLQWDQVEMVMGRQTLILDPVLNLIGGNLNTVLNLIEGNLNTVLNLIEGNIGVK